MLSDKGHFPDFKDDFGNLDNSSLARMQAGIHFRTDHDYGKALGRAMAELVLKQLPPFSSSLWGDCSGILNNELTNNQDQVVS